GAEPHEAASAERSAGVRQFAETAAAGTGRPAEAGGAAVEPLADPGESALGDGHEGAAALGDDVAGLGHRPPPLEAGAKPRRKAAQHEDAAAQLAHAPAGGTARGGLGRRAAPAVARTGANGGPGIHAASVRRGARRTKNSAHPR